MQTKRKRTEIISETATLLIVKKTTSGYSAGWCSECDAEVLWIAPAAFDLFGISNLSGNGVIHKSGAEICSRSLIEEAKKEKI